MFEGVLATAARSYRCISRSAPAATAWPYARRDCGGRDRGDGRGARGGPATAKDQAALTRMPAALALSSFFASHYYVLGFLARRMSNLRCFPTQRCKRVTKLHFSA